MIPFLIGGFLAFKFLCDSKVCSGKKKPARLNQSKEPEEVPDKASPAQEADDTVTVEDYVPEEHMVRRRKCDAKPAPKAPAAAPAPPPAAEKPAEEKKLTLPVRQGGRGSFDDVLEDDPTGVGIDELEEVNGTDYNPEISEPEEEA